MTRHDIIEKRKDELTKAHDAWEHAKYLYIQAFETATDDPEPHADDMETIAEGDEEAGEANLRNSYARTKAMHSKNYASVGDADWDAAVLADEIDRLRAALTRLSSSAPIDVQSKAEAVVRAYSGYYDTLTTEAKGQLSRLIVEQFTQAPKEKE